MTVHVIFSVPSNDTIAFLELLCARIKPDNLASIIQDTEELAQEGIPGV
jgi:hypothetical protein